MYTEEFQADLWHWLRTADHATRSVPNVRYNSGQVVPNNLVQDALDKHVQNVAANSHQGAPKFDGSSSWYLSDAYRIDLKKNFNFKKIIKPETDSTPDDAAIKYLKYVIKEAREAWLSFIKEQKLCLEFNDGCQYSYCRSPAWQDKLKDKNTLFGRYIEPSYWSTLWDDWADLAGLPKTIIEPSTPSPSALIKNVSEARSNCKTTEDFLQFFDDAHTEGYPEDRYPRSDGTKPPSNQATSKVTRLNKAKANEPKRTAPDPIVEYLEWPGSTDDVLVPNEEEGRPALLFSFDSDGRLAGVRNYGDPKPKDKDETTKTKGKPKKEKVLISENHVRSYLKSKEGDPDFTIWVQRCPTKCGPVEWDKTHACCNFDECPSDNKLMMGTVRAVFDSHVPFTTTGKKSPHRWPMSFCLSCLERIVNLVWLMKRGMIRPEDRVFPKPRKINRMSINGSNFGNGKSLIVWEQWFKNAADKDDPCQFKGTKWFTAENWSAYKRNIEGATSSLDLLANEEAWRAPFAQSYGLLAFELASHHVSSQPKTKHKTMDERQEGIPPKLRTSIDGHQGNPVYLVRNRKFKDLFEQERDEKLPWAFPKVAAQGEVAPVLTEDDHGQRSSTKKRAAPEDTEDEYGQRSSKRRQTTRFHMLYQALNESQGADAQVHELPSNSTYSLIPAPYIAGGPIPGGYAMVTGDGSMPATHITNTETPMGATPWPPNLAFQGYFGQEFTQSEPTSQKFEEPDRKRLERFYEQVRDEQVRDEQVRDEQWENTGLRGSMWHEHPEVPPGQAHPAYIDYNPEPLEVPNPSYSHFDQEIAVTEMKQPNSAQVPWDAQEFQFWPHNPENHQWGSINASCEGWHASQGPS